MICVVILQCLRSTLVLAVFSSAIGGSFQYGYNVSIINAPTMHIQEFINKTWDVRHGSQLNQNLLTLLWSIIVSILTLGGFLGTWAGGPLAIRYGRKGALLINNVFALTGAALMGASYSAGMFELLIVGRFLVGLNLGIGICVQPLYLAEISPKRLRGAISMGTSVFLTVGILSGQVIGLRELLGKEEDWPVLLSTTCIPAILQLLLLPWFPESPRYLLIDRQQEEACDRALKMLHDPSDYLSEKEDMEKEQAETQGEKPRQAREVLADRSIRWQLITSIVLNMGQQLSGINAIYFYATYVFKQAGIAQEYIPYAALGSGACECLTALSCGLLIEYLGRRVLILGGYLLMAMWCIVITITLSVQTTYFWIPYLSMACVSAFILSFGLGPGGVTNILTAELFTQSTRPAASMISGSMGWLSFFFIGIIFPFIVERLQQFCFLVFLVECLLMVCYIFYIIPETKNKSFLEIKKDFQTRNFKEASGIGKA
ncbi:solute carrier family 2, facilitated glucose transporter member 11b [Callorhinchus milii]|uniref:Solute carrier family 2 member 11b n=1 Tax=Callorhinchus milii TaxID=7868 RepID=A0A4W3I0K9_CALMI|nr:solute carrier family 2, facilitated glucose transporter member 11b [Callorhinchus milii]|eukprot:gi/632983309/ref/XP_007908583.1/ PREDICTED: solute carrier family 2, facilitated glucose transporter member 11-like [Callorhinchus milii]